MFYNLLSASNSSGDLMILPHINVKRQWQAKSKNNQQVEL